MEMSDDFIRAVKLLNSVEATMVEAQMLPDQAPEDIEAAEALRAKVEAMTDQNSHDLEALSHLVGNMSVIERHYVAERIRAFQSFSLMALMEHVMGNAE